jgi:serine/threonine-protein kinase HipA
MKVKELRVLIADREAGSIIEGTRGKFRLVYDAAWQSDPAAMPLSLSMPLAAAGHGDDAVRPFLWGLLPDNEETLSQWGRRYGVSPRNPFALLSFFGEDLAGAVQLVPAGKVGTLKKRQGTSYLSPKALAEHFAELLREPGATQFTEEGGQFSLAGAQRKKALYRAGGKWYEPRGRTPSTHILKPPIPGFAGQVENEVFCLQLAAELGLAAPATWVESFGELPVFVIERYDRVRMAGRKQLALDETGGEVRRVHQEDCCQALKVLPQNKYERDGGPGVRRIMELLSGSNRPVEDRDRFMRSLALNFIIGGSDAHAKNFSLLISGGGRFRLAPLYDVISILPYLKGKRGARLAMSIDGHSKFDEIMPRHWQSAARKSGYSPDRAVGHVRDLLDRLPDAASDVLDRHEGTMALVLQPLKDILIARCQELRVIYGAEALAE